MVDIKKVVGFYNTLPNKKHTLKSKVLNVLKQILLSQPYIFQYKNVY